MKAEYHFDRALELKNGDFVLGKVRSPENRIGRLLARKLPDADMVTELFLATLSRLPTDAETRSVLDHVTTATDRRAAWEDVQWALLNTNEFLFRH